MADSNPSSPPIKPLLSISGSLISHAHSTLGFLSFSGALAFALSLHYEKVVKNGVARYPDEWFPSVSATIGDWYPERNWFQVGIAFMSGPRILLVLLSSLLVSLSNPTAKSIFKQKAFFLFMVGTLRTVACAGWVYVTSSDDHDFHDIAMGLYLILTPPWMYVCSGSLVVPPSKKNKDSSKTDRDEKARKAKKMRLISSLSFFACIPFMVYFFIKHKVDKIPGAYSYYAYFEWGLIVFDLLFDAASVYDLSRLEIQIVEARQSSSLSKSCKPVAGTWAEAGSAGSISSGAWSSSVANPSTSQKEEKRDETKKIEKELEMEDSKLPQAAPVGFLRDLLSWISDIFLSYCGWTTFTSLHPTIFWHSVYNMGIGGHEALLVSQVLGLLFVLAIPSLKNALVAKDEKTIKVGPISPMTQSILQLLSLAGIASWWVDSMLIRLLATAFGSAIVAINWAVRFGGAWENAEGVGRESSIWLVGLLLSSLSKYANHSNNPLSHFLNSTNGGRQEIGLPIALLCVLEVGLRSPNRSAPAARRITESQGSIFEATAAALGLGALIYALHTFLSDSGTMIACGWTGHPVVGPTALAHGWILLTVASVSIALSIQSPDLVFTPFLIPLGLLSFASLLVKDDWQSFNGAVGISIFLPLLAAPLWRSAMRHDPLKIMTGAWLVTNVLTFLGVLTVAYAFVPGGKVMRERSGSMAVVLLAFLSIGLFQAWRTQDSKTPVSKTSSNSSSPFQLFKARLLTLCLPTLLILSCASYQIPSVFFVDPSSIVPSFPEDRIFTAGIWTVHFALDQHLRDSSRRMSEVMGDLNLDVIGLLESDLQRPVFGNRDLTLWLAQELGMYADIGPGPMKHTWGCALLSKFPIINSTHHLLPSPNGELAPMIHAVLDIHGVETHVVVSHNGQEEDPLDRELQTTEIARILSEAYPHPALFLGYVVTKPHAKRPDPYEILNVDGKMLDVEKTDLRRWCEYIFYRGLERIGYVRVSRYTVTDTELQTAKFLVPPIGQPISPDVNVRPRLVSEEEMPLNWRYPSKFIDPPAMVYERHKYSPYYYPQYYAPESKEEPPNP